MLRFIQPIEACCQDSTSSAAQCGKYVVILEQGFLALLISHAPYVSIVLRARAGSCLALFGFAGLLRF